MIKVAYIGGLGLMAGPGASHLSKGEEARVLTVHDRGTPGLQRDEFRRAWTAHGAKLVPSLAALTDADRLDGIVICAGKNGDDLPIVAESVKLLQHHGAQDPFILHLSTVSSSFCTAAAAFASRRGVEYANYPLTGGPAGASFGGGHPQGMLILAAGSEALYRRLEGMLNRLGQPRYFGPRTSAGAEVKLIGQHLVFNGLSGISTGAALYAQCFTNGILEGEDQATFFDFLNRGAGGTRQWDVALSKGIRDGQWGQGFSIAHAAVDAVYAAALAIEHKLPRYSIQPMLQAALSFSFMLGHTETEIPATHAVARELVGAPGAFDAFLGRHGFYEPDSALALSAAIESMPDRVRRSVLLEVSSEAFEVSAARTGEM
ncbi:MAG: NAD(P)-dependent oxidoreductase [Bdellovibrionales bacterium]|nr:NAD(P)-dependent oxidoreductase [Bdellovibrionales bacterium]